MCASAAEFRRVEEGYRISVINETRKDIGLMEGFLTLPFAHNVTCKIDRMYDHALGHDILWWNGFHTCAPDDELCYAVPPGTNEHPGIDYRIAEGTPILAAGPGVIQNVDTIDNSLLIRHTVEAYNLPTDRRPIFTNYAHLSKIIVQKGQFVKRGDTIGFSGSTHTPYPHLHFDLRSAPINLQHWAFIDPYEPIVEVPSGFWLSGDQLPQWTTEYHPANNLNWWTVFNDPQFHV